LTPDLRVVLTTWLNAYEYYQSVETTGHDLERMRTLADAEAKLAEANANLFLVATDEVEEPPVGELTQLVHNRYAVPSKERLVTLMTAAAQWLEANAILNRTEQPLRKHYEAVEKAETEIRRFLATCRRNARARQLAP